MTTTYNQKSNNLFMLLSNANYAEEPSKSDSRVYPVYLKSAIADILRMCNESILKRESTLKKPLNQTAVNIALSTQGLKILEECEYLTALSMDWDTLCASNIGNKPEFIEVEWIRTKYNFKSKVIKTNFYASPGVKRQIQNKADKVRLNYDVMHIMAQTMACKWVFDELETTLRPTVYEMICIEIERFKHFVEKQRIHLAVEFNEELFWDEEKNCIYLDHAVYAR